MVHLKLVNTLPADDLASYVTRSSAVMTLAMWNGDVFVFHERKSDKLTWSFDGMQWYKMQIHVYVPWKKENQHEKNSDILIPDSKVYGASMGPNWGRQDPGGPHVGPMDLAIWVFSLSINFNDLYWIKVKEWFKKHQKYIYIFYYCSMLKWCGYLKPSLVLKDQFILYSQHHCCWWPGDESGLGISINDIITDDLVYHLFHHQEG